MEKLTCSLLPFEIADGPTNMADDEVLLQSAQKGVASLRFYGWSQPTLSLGYFQSEKLRHADPNLASLPFVRRPSGGEMLVHHHELTYALALSPGPWQDGEPWPVRMHRIIATALEGLGVSIEMLAKSKSHARRKQEVLSSLCFQHPTSGDLLVAGCKVVGSAQRKQRGAIMQHGGILLAKSPHAPALAGILELTGKKLNAQLVCERIQSAFAAYTGAKCEVRSWSLDEVAAIGDLSSNKYETRDWNCKR